MKLDIVAGSGNDEFYTPIYAIQPILEFIKPNSTIWCPFDTDESLFIKTFKENNFNVINSHILDGIDFLIAMFLNVIILFPIHHIQKNMKYLKDYLKLIFLLLCWLVL